MKLAINTMPVKGRNPQKQRYEGAAVVRLLRFCV